ncbi:hypothetical protein Bca4012_025672 [Brassica carinata]
MGYIGTTRWTVVYSVPEHIPPLIYKEIDAGVPEIDSLLVENSPLPQAADSEFKALLKYLKDTAVAPCNIVLITGDVDIYSELRSLTTGYHNVLVFHDENTAGKVLKDRSVIKTYRFRDILGNYL